MLRGNSPAVSHPGSSRAKNPRRPIRSSHSFHYGLQLQTPPQTLSSSADQDEGSGAPYRLRGDVDVGQIAVLTHNGEVAVYLLSLIHI